MDLSSFKPTDKISTLGPVKTNSYYAAKAFMAANHILGEPVLAETAPGSFDLLLNDQVDACVVCCLYPDIHKLYIPNLKETTVSDVFIDNARMGLFKRKEVREIHTVAAPITSTVFVKDDSFEVIIANSNAEAARMCQSGEVDAAVATTDSAADCGLETVRDFGIFAVPYAVFRKRGRV